MLHASRLEVADYAKAMQGLETAIVASPAAKAAELSKLEQLLTPLELTELAASNPTIRQELEQRSLPAAAVVQPRAPPTRLIVTAAVPGEMREVLHQLGLQDAGIQRQAQRKRSQQRFTPRSRLRGSQSNS